MGLPGSAGIPARKLGAAKLTLVRAHALMAGKDARAPRQHPLGKLNYNPL